MAREPWKCPSADCKRECSRYSNMIRHIDRMHPGLGKPVKDKPSDVNQTRPDKSDWPNWSSPRYPKKRPSKPIDGEGFDLIDTVHDIVKKTQVKTDKIKEIEAFFSQAHARMPSPAIVPVSPIGLPVGFKMYTCEKCMTSPIDPVKMSDFIREGPDAFRISHVCRHEDLEIKKQRANKGIRLDLITTWDKLHSFSIEFIATSLHQWFGPQTDLCVNVVEVDELAFRDGKLLPINLGTIGSDHWIHRALNDDKRIGSTIIDENELKAFLKFANGTLALFRSEIKNQDKYFYASILPKLL
jgi:hypothetical protein